MVRAAALAALLVTSMPAGAQATAGFMLREWSSLDQHDRLVALVAGIEGLLLTTSAPVTSGVDADCLVAISLPKLEADMRQAASVRDGEFVTGLLEVSKCSRP